MATARQIKANRLNARKCCGPRTPAGRARSSQNALKHGIDAKAEVIRTESREKYNELVAQFNARFTPSTPQEHQLVHELIRSEWLTRRAAAGQASVINQSLDENSQHDLGRVFLEHSNQICRSQHILNRAARDFSRALRDLTKIRAQKPPANQLPPKNLTQNRFRSSNFTSAAPNAHAPAAKLEFHAHSPRANQHDGRRRRRKRGPDHASGPHRGRSRSRTGRLPRTLHHGLPAP
jgi:hypothetical protein